MERMSVDLQLALFWPLSWRPFCARAFLTIDFFYRFTCGPQKLPAPRFLA
jgi:hypothetical protein